MFARLEATVLESPDLSEVLRRVDVVVYASGSERVRRMIAPGVQRIRISPRARSRTRSTRCCCRRWRICGRHAARARLGGGMNRGDPMKINDMNWMQVEDYLKRDDRAVLPIGSTEQHARPQPRWSTASWPSASRWRRPSRWACRSSRRCSYGITPYFMAFPGTVSLRVETLLRVVRDVLDCLYGARLPPHPARQRPWRQPAGAVLAQRMDGRASGRAASSSTTGGTRRRPGPR